MGLVTWTDFLLRQYLLFSGDLRCRSFSVDSDTTISCYLSSSLLRPSNQGVDEKPLLLLIHGFGPSSFSQWKSQLAHLSAHFQLVVPDLVFFGSSTTRSSARSISFQAQCISKLMEIILKDNSKHNRFSVLGTSYGGFVAYHMAKQLGKERVDKVVIASSDLLKTEADDQALAQRAGVRHVSDLMLPMGTAEMRALAAVAVHRPPSFMPEFIVRDILQSLNGNRKQKLELLKAIPLYKKDEFQLTPLPQEVLIVWGDQDQIFLVDKAYEIKKRLGEKAKIDIVDNTGHMPQLEDPAKFNKILLNFLLKSS